MKLHRDIKVTQKTAWYMLRRLRDSWSDAGLDQFLGPDEVDETYIGGKERNKHAHKKLRGRTGNGRESYRSRPRIGKASRSRRRSFLLPAKPTCMNS